MREARPTIFFGVPRVWREGQAGIQAKLAAEENERRRRIAQRAVETGLEVVRRTQRGQAVPFGLRARHALLERLVLAKVRTPSAWTAACSPQRSLALAVDVAEFFAALGLPVVELYGMTETTAAATGNRPGKLKLGTVGPALDGVESASPATARCSVRGPVNTPGYFRQAEATAELIDADGWLHTGDGELDDDGYQDRRPQERADHHLQRQEPVPANIEGLLKEHPLIGQALVYGDDRPYVVALIVLDHELAPAWAAGNGLDGSNLTALAASDRVQAEVRLAVDAVNQRLSRIEQVKRFEPGRVDRRERGAHPHPQAPPAHHPRQVRRPHRHPVRKVTGSAAEAADSAAGLDGVGHSHDVVTVVAA